MELASVRPVTVSCDRTAFPCQLAYVSPPNRMWWAMGFLYQVLAVRMRKFLWLRWVVSMLDEVSLLRGDRHVYLRSGANVSGTLKANVCSTLALLVLFWHLVHRQRDELTRQACLG